MEKLDYYYEKVTAERPFAISNKLLVSGSTNCSLRVLRALSLPALTPISDEMYKMMDEIKELTKYIFQTNNRLTLAHQVSGSGGIETALLNLVEPGEKILVAIAGIWGVITVMKAENAGIEVASITVDEGEVFTVEELEEQIIKHKPVLLSVTHSDSSHGTLQPLEKLGDLCHKHNCLLLVDAVLSIGTDPLFVDRWNIDVVIAATQKGIGAPPGMSLLTFSPRAEERLLKRKSPVPLYFDIKTIADYWNCYGNARKYCYTFNSNLLAAVREALMEIAEEGLINVWERHKTCAEQFWKAIEKNGLNLFVKKPENRVHSVTTVVLPKEIHWSTLYDYMDKKYLVEFGCGLGPTLNKAIRVGFMSKNSKPEVVDYFIKKFTESIEYLKLNEHKISSKTALKIS